MNKKIVIDKNLCIGCGLCESLCPEVFKLQSDGKSKVIKEKGCEKCDCELVADNCPVKAIKIVVKQ